MKKLIQELSQREKVLLYTLLCFLILVGGWFFVVTTTIDSYNSACMEYEEAVTKKADKDRTLQNYLLAPDALAVKKESYTKIVDKYNPILKNEKVDKLITTAILSQGLKPVSLEITTPDNSATNTTNTAGASAQTDIVSNESIKQVNVNVTLNGSFEKITKLISHLGSLKGVSVSNLQYTEGGSATGSNVSMTIIVYMIKK
ncbi:MAG: hypothetical protein RR558_00260 [Coprobacillus sp.]